MFIWGPDLHARGIRALANAVPQQTRELQPRLIDSRDPLAVALILTHGPTWPLGANAHWVSARSV